MVPVEIGESGFYPIFWFLLCLAADGGWTEFQEANYTQCSQTCGGGTLNITSTRTCSNPAPRYGGQNCSGQDTVVDTAPCKEQPCPGKQE